MKGKAGKFSVVVLGVFGLVAVILWSGGFFIKGKIEPGKEQAALGPRASWSPEAGNAARAELATIEDYNEAVGTVRARTETRVEAQVSAKVLQVLVTPGEKVVKGQTLIVLDDRELRSRKDQAGQGLESAEAARAQAEQAILAARAAFAEAASQYKRIKSLYDEQAVTSRELDQAQAGYLQAEAGLRQAEKGLAGAEAAVERAREVEEESDIALGYAEIKAHEGGEVASRDVEPGDIAFPGKTLLTLHTGESMRLEALVSEGLIQAARPGRELDVVITALELRVKGVVEEVVPNADPRTRTFLVKVGLPGVAGLYPGMFGRLMVPMGERRAVMIPARAVRRVGQLETVDVLVSGPDEPANWRTVYVKTGQERGGQVEILSGLEGGELVALPPSPDQAAESEGNGTEAGND